VGGGQRLAALTLALAGEPRLLGGGLGVGDGGRAVGLGLGDPGVLGRLGLLLDLVAVGVGRLADLGVELAVGERGGALGDLLLLREDLLVAGCLREGPGGRRLRSGRVGLGQDLGFA
jgi:hypothetical protein